MKQENSEIGKKVLTDGLDQGYPASVAELPCYQIQKNVCSNCFAKVFFYLGAQKWYKSFYIQYNPLLDSFRDGWNAIVP